MILFIGQVASSQRDREAFQEVDYRQMFGPGTLGFAKWVGEVHDPDRLPEYVGARLPRRDAGPARSGRARAARGHAGDADRGAGARARRARARRARARGAGALARAARRRRAAVRHRRRQRLDGGACAALERFAERWQLPVGCAFRFQDVFDNRHPNYAGDVGIGINPKLAARIRDADLIVAIGPRLGEMTTGGYELLDAAEGRASSSSTSMPAPRSSAASTRPTWRSTRRWRAPRRRWRRSSAPADDPLVGVDRRGARRLRGQPRADAGRAARHGRGRSRDRAPRSGRHDLHQRRRQLQRLAASLPSLRRPAPRRPHASSRRPRARWATACRPRSPRRCSSRIARVVNLAGDGDFLMNGQELATAIAHGAGQGAGKLVSIVVDNGTYGTIRMHQEREYPGRVSGSRPRQPRLRRARARLRLVGERARRHDGGVRAGAARRARRRAGRR